MDIAMASLALLTAPVFDHSYLPFQACLLHGMSSKNLSQETLCPRASGGNVTGAPAA